MLRGKGGGGALFWSSRTVLGMERTSRITARRAVSENRPTTDGNSAAAAVPEIDQRIGKGLECVVDLAEPVRPKQ
jgi:hypothetical protein